MSPQFHPKLDVAAIYRRDVSRPRLCGFFRRPRITPTDAMILTQLLPDRNGDHFAEVVQALKMAGSENPAGDAHAIIGAYASYRAAACIHRHPPDLEPPEPRTSTFSGSALLKADQPGFDTELCDLREGLRQLAARFMAGP